MRSRSATPACLLEQQFPPCRDDPNAGNGKKQREDRTDEGDLRDEDDDATTTPTLSVEIPVGTDRNVATRYPRDLTANEAKNVGNVLHAIVS